MFLYTGLAITELAWVPSWWALIGLAAIFGAGSGATQAGLSASVQGSVEPDLRGSAAAVQFTAFDLLLGFGSWTLGLLADVTNYGVLYASVSGVVLVGLLAGGFILQRERLDCSVDERSVDEQR